MGTAHRNDRPAFVEIAGHRFRDPALLALALTHRSRANELEGGPANESLEFLGDAVLGLLVARALYDAGEGKVPPGDLSRRRAAIVSEASLARAARALDLGPALFLGKGEELSGGRDKDSILADAFEAVVAAVYLDAGLPATRRFVLRALGEAIRAASEEGAERDPRTTLQERMQARGVAAPEYRVVESKGPSHAPTFVVEVFIEGAVAGRGEGPTKKAAGAAAAADCLSRLPK